MKNYNLTRNERGLSTAIVIFVLIGATLAGGFVTYQAFRGYVTSSTANISLRVQYLKALSTSGGEYATATVKNAGQTGVEDVTVTIINSEGQNVKMQIVSLEPSETGSGQASKVDLSAGVTYPVEVTASVPGKKDAYTVALRVQVS